MLTKRQKIESCAPNFSWASLSVRFISRYMCLPNCSFINMKQFIFAPRMNLYFFGNIGLLVHYFLDQYICSWIYISMEIWGCSCYLTSVHFLLELLHPCTPCPAYGPPCYCMVVRSSALYCTIWYCTPCLAYGSSSKALYGIGWQCVVL